jgi:hypothetical protein
MSVIPKIICPPDYSIRCFRLIDPMSYGIVKGAATEISIPTKGICIPVNRYDDKRMILKSGSVVKIDISGIAEYGDLQESYQFSVDLSTTPDIIGDGTKHKYDLYDSDLNLISSMEFTVSGTFSQSLLAALSANSAIYGLMNFDTGDISNGNFSVTAITKGVKYRHVFYFDLDGFGGSEPYPYVHPGNLIQKYRKYPDGRMKLMLIIPEFSKVNTDTCGCADSSGTMLSNKKYFQYALASDYEKTKTPSTPILAAGENTSYLWNQQSTDHIGYHFSLGDLINMNTAVTSRALIQSIQGYSISTDTEIGNNTQSNLVHVWSPSSVTWKTGGEMSLFTGGQDVNDADRLFIETIYLKNPHAFDIPMRILIGV